MLISNGVQLSPKSTSGKHKKYANQLNEARRVFEIRTINFIEYILSLRRNQVFIQQNVNLIERLGKLFLQLIEKNKKDLY